jgi:hypothetical protein
MGIWFNIQRIIGLVHAETTNSVKLEMMFVSLVPLPPSLNNRLPDEWLSLVA